METGLLSFNGYNFQHVMTSSQPFPSTSLFQYFSSPKTKTSRRRWSRSSLRTTCTATTATVPNSPPRTRSRVTRKLSAAEAGKVAQKKVNPNRVSLLARKAAVIDIQQSSHLESALTRSGPLLNVQDLNIILREFGRSSRWKDLSQLFEWMQTNGKVNTSSYSSYIKFLGGSSNLSKALKIYNDIEDKSTRNNVSICNALLGSLTKNQKFDHAMELFYQMKQHGLDPDAVTYSTLLSGCIKVKSGYSKALQLVQELETKALTMDSVLYGTLIAVCAANNQCKEAEEYFLRMKAEGHFPNIFHFSSLLNAYSTEGNYEKADELVKDMNSSGLLPNKVMLTTLLKVYVRGGLFEKARLLLTKLEDLGYAGDEMPYCLLMDALSKAGKIDETKLVFEDMNKKGVKSDGYAHSIMISAFCRGGQLKEAKQLARDYDSSCNKYDVVILNTMLCAYCRIGDMDSVMQTMRKMDQLAIIPDRHTFHILIRYFCKEKLYLLAYRTLEDMHRKGYQIEEEHCSTLINHLGKMGAHTEAFSVYNILKYSKRTMRKALHERILHILISGRLLKDAYLVIKDNAKWISQAAVKRFLTSFMKIGNINLINDVLKAVHTSGHKIDQEVFQMAVLRYVEQPEKKELLLQLLNWMPSHGFMVDSTRNLILKNAHSYGHQLIAEILSKHAKARALLSSGQR